jgi:hypothetical protein
MENKRNAKGWEEKREWKQEEKANAEGNLSLGHLLIPRI